MKTNKNLIRGVALTIAMLLVAPPAHANAIVPVMVTGWIAMALALVPVILVEVAVVTATGARIGETLLAMAVANLASTLAGLPVAIVLEVIVFGASQAYDRTDKVINSAAFKIPLIGVSLLIPFFLVSWGIETVISNWLLHEIRFDMVAKAVFAANVATYSVFAVLLAGWLIVSFWGWEKEVMDRKRFYPDYPSRWAWESKLRRDAALRNQPRPTRRAALDEVWRRANRHAKEGIGRLKMAETMIGRRYASKAAEDMRKRAEERLNEVA